MANWRLYTKRMEKSSSAFEKADSQWEQIFKCRLENWHRTLINIIYPSMFQYQRLTFKAQKPVKALV
jgi:hypothetical protein